MNDIQVTFENQQSDVNPDDDWDPMREEYEDPTKNSYDCGPGANLDLNLQRPRYRFNHYCIPLTPIIPLNCCITIFVFCYTETRTTNLFSN